MKTVKLLLGLSVLLFAGACKSQKKVPINSVRYTVTEDSKKYIPVHSGDTRESGSTGTNKKRR